MLKVNSVEGQAGPQIYQVSHSDPHKKTEGKAGELADISFGANSTGVLHEIQSKLSQKRSMLHLAQKLDNPFAEAARLASENVFAVAEESFKPSSGIRRSSPHHDIPVPAENDHGLFDIGDEDTAVAAYINLTPTKGIPVELNPHIAAEPKHHTNPQNIPAADEYFDIITKPEQLMEAVDTDKDTTALSAEYAFKSLTSPTTQKQTPHKRVDGKLQCRYTKLF